MATSFRSYLNVGIHVLGWSLLGFLQLFYIPLSWNVEVPAFFWLWHCIVLIMLIILFYANAKVIVPRTIIAGKPWLFLLWILAAIFMTQFVAYQYTQHTDMHNRMATLLNTNREYFILDNFVFTISLLVLALSTGWAMMTHWQRSSQREKQLEQDKTHADIKLLKLQQDKTNTELEMLKMQINPHFFFNSLNSVYSLTYIDVEDSRKALLTLSRMMRYLLYSAEGEDTSLSKEIVFLKDYIAIMRLRATEKVNIIVEIPDVMEDFPIAPMLLLPFVENAFKHGVDPTAGTEIRIALWMEGTKLFMDVTNGVFARRNLEHDEGGIGLTNTRRRLELLYPGRHELTADINTDGKYQVKLNIDLAA